MRNSFSLSLAKPLFFFFFFFFFHLHRTRTHTTGWLRTVGALFGAGRGDCSGGERSRPFFHFFISSSIDFLGDKTRPSPRHAKGIERYIPETGWLGTTGSAEEDIYNISFIFSGRHLFHTLQK
ncbi:hypothetical protein BDP81DRAFT_54689 [Colletotrichum phormii]|uniref:Uncharacterized protein n=1 Tax=Colletotrichum phormii TaxID=359342 RepID=A0AAJ0EFB3_9PEZI|nr:uncharacterized protein BDP81DRAFT_54689 [Colletotrichum phormii]KAK1634916.1 hypothetical protein BDP81DRAFT_54689 [Colletotrichum phormii]